MNQLQIEDTHLIIVKNILKKFHVKFFVFGSRSRNAAKRFSDLDLCIKDQFSKAELRNLKDLFEESKLPFKVDLIIWNEISDEFKKHIEKDLIEIEL